MLRDVVPVIPVPVLAETWGSPGQHPLGPAGPTCSVEVLDQALAKAAGELCGRARVTDVVMPPWQPAPLGGGTSG